jgi:hypothetical protein
VYYGPIVVDLGYTGVTTVGVLPDNANRFIPHAVEVVFQKESGTLTTPAIAVLDDGTAGHTVASSTTFTSAAKNRVFPMAIPANAYTITDTAAPLTFRVTTAAVGSSTTFRARTDNVALLTTGVPHGYVAGDVVTIRGITADNTYNQENATVISAPTTTTFTYYAEGADESSTADTSGRVSSSTALVYVVGLLF